MADIKKFLDQEGLRHLWARLSMEDYPNNETLMAVINAIDQTKADRDELVQPDWNNTNPTSLGFIQNKPFGDIEKIEVVNEDSLTIADNENLATPLTNVILDCFNENTNYNITFADIMQNQAQQSYLKMTPVVATLDLYYATLNDRYISCTVNGTVHNLYCLGTGGWTAVGPTPASMEIELTQQSNIITFGRGEGSEFAPNLDRFDITVNGTTTTYQIEDGAVVGSTTTMAGTEGETLIGNVGGPDYNTMTLIVPNYYSTPAIDIIDDEGIILATVYKDYRSIGPTITFNPDLYTAGQIISPIVILGAEGAVKTIEPKYLSGYTTIDLSILGMPILYSTGQIVQMKGGIAAQIHDLTMNQTIKIRCQVDDIYVTGIFNGCLTENDNSVSGSFNVVINGTLIQIVFVISPTLITGYVVNPNIGAVAATLEEL